MFPARFIRAKDLQGKSFTLMIRELRKVEVFDRRKNQKVSRWAIFFDHPDPTKKGPEK